MRGEPDGCGRDAHPSQPFTHPCPSLQVNRLGDENGSLLERLQEAQAAVAQAAAAVDAADAEGSNGAAELAAARQVRCCRREDVACCFCYRCC